MEFHRPRIAALVGAGADVLACETLPSLPEAEALLELMAEVDVESWLTFTLRDGAHVSDGTPLEQVAELCNAEPLVAAIGVNCVPLELVTPALDALGRATRKPLIAYPNSGETYDATTKTWGPATSARGGAGTERPPASLAEGIRAWQERGARMVGGCCRTTPNDIAALARLWRQP
jgi:homocysteine S-methyltransferase